MKIVYFTILLMGCNDEKTTTQDTGVLTDEPSSDDTQELEDPCIPKEGEDGFRMEGNVQYIDGTEGAGNVRVQMCNSQSCYIGKWGDNGFCFPAGVLSPGYSYAFDTVPLLGEENQYATPLTFITIDEGDELLQLSVPVIIPEYTSSAPTSNEEINAENGLIIFIGDQAIEGEQVFATPVNNEEWGLPLPEFEGRNILGIWYLGPFETHLDTPWTFSFSNPQTDNLAPGTQIEIYNADYENQEWKNAGTATKSDAGIFTPDANAGIFNLSTLVLVQ